MLSLILGLAGALSGPVEVVTAYHGDRVEWVFTTPEVISAASPCEWVGPRLDGTEVRVCGGTVTALRLGSDVRMVTR